MVPLQGGKIHHPLGFFRTAPRLEGAGMNLREKTCASEFWSGFDKILRLFQHTFGTHPLTFTNRL